MHPLILAKQIIAEKAVENQKKNSKCRIFSIQQTWSSWKATKATSGCHSSTASRDLLARWNVNSTTPNLYLVTMKVQTVTPTLVRTKPLCSQFLFTSVRKRLCFKERRFQGKTGLASPKKHPNRNRFQSAPARKRIGQKGVYLILPNRNLTIRRRKAHITECFPTFNSQQL